MSSMSPWNPSVRGPNATLSKIDFGNGLGRWNTRPMRAHRYRVDIPPIRIDAPVAHVARDAAARHEVVQSVQATEQRALAGAGRADERDDRAARTGNETSATAGTPL
jgi:hypothetical protein